MKYTREQIESWLNETEKTLKQSGVSAGLVHEIVRQLLAENDALREDAERYRYVAPMQGFHDFVIHETGCYVDDLVSATRAIDAARKKY